MYVTFICSVGCLKYIILNRLVRVEIGVTTNNFLEIFKPFFSAVLFLYVELIYPTPHLPGKMNVSVIRY